MQPMLPETRSRAKTAASVFALALVITFALAAPAFAQAGGDVLGVSTLREAAILVFKAIAALAVGFVFLKLMAGRHAVEAIVVVAVGALGIAKLDAIVSLLGL